MAVWNYKPIIICAMSHLLQNKNIKSNNSIHFTGRKDVRNSRHFYKIDLQPTRRRNIDLFVINKEYLHDTWQNTLGNLVHLQKHNCSEFNSFLKMELYLHCSYFPSFYLFILTKTHKTEHSIKQHYFYVILKADFDTFY